MYPKKELPFFILFTAGLCSFTALLALLTHQYPEPMGVVVRTVSSMSQIHTPSIFPYYPAGTTHTPIPRTHGGGCQNSKWHKSNTYTPPPSLTALLALLTHQYPEPMGVVVRTVSSMSQIHTPSIFPYCPAGPTHTPIPRTHGGGCQNSK